MRGEPAAEGFLERACSFADGVNLRSAGREFDVEVMWAMFSAELE